MFDNVSDPSQSLRGVAFYLPQFHPVPENDAFWGAGFTEWRNVVQARPRFSGHLQPHLPADLGFYDLRLAETRVAQADLARRAGLSGFCYYHYWFSGRRVLHEPLDRMLADQTPDFPFMLCWANENWTRAWDGGENQILLAQRYSDADTRNHARHLAAIFADRRYIRIHGRPVFAVYNTDQMPCPRRWTDIFRSACQAEGNTPYLIRVERYLDQDQRAPQALGFDAALEFQPFSRTFRCWQETRPDLKRSISKRVSNRLRKDWQRVWPGPPRDRLHDMAAFVEFDIEAAGPDYTLFPGVCPSWDNSARRPPGKAIVFRGSHPKLFSRWLEAKVQRFQPPSSEENLVFINAWNEWAEGNHLEPCMRYGHQWLDALQHLDRSVVTAS